MTREHSQSQCSVKNPAPKSTLHDEASSFLLGNPEEIIEALQLWKRVGHKKFTDLLQAIIDHQEKSAAKIVEDIGVGGKLPKERGGMRRKALQAFMQYVADGYYAAADDLNNRQRQVAFLRLYGCSHAEIGQELGMSAATSRGEWARARTIVKEIKIRQRVSRQQ